MQVPIENLKEARVYRAAPARRLVLVSIMVAIYAVVLPYCYITAGEPRRAAAISAQALADERWAADAARLAANGTDLSLSGNDTMSSSSDTTSAAAAAAAAVSTIEGNAGDFDSDNADGVSFLPLPTNSTSSKKAAPPAVPSWLAGWFGPNKEQKRAQKELEAIQKQFNERNEEPLSLPPSYLPGAWACLALFSALTVHALFHLLCHWIVSFRAAALYSPASKVEVGCFLLVQPPENRGKASLAEIKKNEQGGLQAEFQRQTYLYTPALKIDAERRRDFPHGVFTLSTCPINLPLKHYLQHPGLKTMDAERLLQRWGKNHLAVHIPSFLELLQAQLLSPLAIFQVFCALLWLLDEYWSYTLWTLASVVVFEATTVFHRTRTQKMLGGMAPRPSPVFVFRQGSWGVLTTKDLLPGDVISLGYKRRSGQGQGQGQGQGEAAKPAIEGAPAADAATTATAVNAASTNAPAAAPMGASVTSYDDTVPCDCLLITGSAVVNEASLTGESVPQMKEALSDPKAAGGSSITEGDEADSGDRLDMNGTHRVSVLFSGTSLLTVDPGLSDSAASNGASDSGIPTPPDKGAVAYVLRTGFSSSQGALMQMIEFSQQTVAGNAREIGLALFVLFLFALAAAGYVLREGLRKKEKTTHEILLKCVIIITSVVPRQFPMQTAVAVNMALMALVKVGIFCTEQYRVPLAGKVTHCLFDKTGTLTTDQLVPVGLVNADASAGSERVGGERRRSISSGGEVGSGSTESPPMCEVSDALPHAQMVLAACHSLVVVESDAPVLAEVAAASMSKAATLAGDPIELASIKGVQWHWEADTSTARPGSWAIQEAALAVLQAKAAEMRAIPQAQRNPQAAFDAQLDSLQKQAVRVEEKIAEAHKKAAASPFVSVRIAARHHFSSALQRMSVVAQCEVRSSATSSSSGNSSVSDAWFALVKGSPEALLPLFSPAAVPAWYTACYESLARKGLRVLALGYKRISVPGTQKPTSFYTEQPRANVESDLTFCGFIAFQCKIRADSRVVITALKESDHKVTMLTGDALLTSLHVAKEVRICSTKRPTLTLRAGRCEGDTCFPPTWAKRTEAPKAKEGQPQGEAVEETVAFRMADIPTLSESCELLTTEADFLAIAESTAPLPESGNGKSKKADGTKSELWRFAGCFRVFARMSPQGKASVIRAIQAADPDHHVLMCGDGGNDVGALKQADIGIALLAGHANANTTEDVGPEDSDTALTTTDASSAAAPSKSAEDALNAHEEAIKQRSEATNQLRVQHMKEFQARYTRESQAKLQETVKELTEKGEYMKMFSAMKGQAVQMKIAINNENIRFMQTHGQVWDPKKDPDGDAAGSQGGFGDLLASMESTEAAGLPMVRPGDASVAAPFTSRVPSVRAVVDLIRQGRCTLLSALMHQQIMMLESIIAAYTLSALSLHNARSSERQMMASQWLIMTAAVSFSYSAPLDHMHPLRPLRSLFHPAIFLSMLGQAAIHIACMTLAVQWATDAMGPEKLKEVTEFFKKAKAKEIDASSLCGEDDVMCQIQAFWTAPFLPNLLNTTVFLVETSQMISVFFANYKGRPWMKGMLENHALFLSVFACIGGVVVASWEMVPQLNDMIQLAPFPDDLYRYKVVALVMATIAGTFLWDRLCVLIFAPECFRAQMDEANKTTLKDLQPVAVTMLKVLGVVFVLGTGNILMAGVAYYFYRNANFNAAQKQVVADGKKK